MRPNKVTSSILLAYERSRYRYRAVTQISQRYPAPIVARRRSEPRRRREKRNVTRDETSRFGPHIEPENCTAPRETETRTNFFLPLDPCPSLPPPLHVFSYTAPKYILLLLLLLLCYCCSSSSSSHRVGFKTKMYVPIGWSLFVRDCETRFLRKRREKLQSRFVERFD